MLTSPAACVLHLSDKYLPFNLEEQKYSRERYKAFAKDSRRSSIRRKREWEAVDKETVEFGVLLPGSSIDLV
jgi:hypothetical protein